MPHNSPLCASLGHYVGTLVVIYCPHQQRWEFVVTAGDDTDDQELEHRHVEFGPFDSAAEVARRVGSEATQLVNVTSRLWLDRRQEEATARALDGE